MNTKRYQEIASRLKAIENCQKGLNSIWEMEHKKVIDDIMDLAPSGSGIDSGTTLDMMLSTPEHLVFHCSYHHMNENGYYDGWTDHVVHVTPSLTCGFSLRITGTNRNGIKDYLIDVYSTWLDEEVNA